MVNSSSSAISNRLIVCYTHSPDSHIQSDIYLMSNTIFVLSTSFSIYNLGYVGFSTADLHMSDTL